MSRQQSAFTIVELLIVIVIIAILATITIVAFNGVQNRANVSAMRSELSSAGRQIQVFRAQDAAENFPANLASADVKFANTYRAQYQVNNNTNPKTYCITLISSSPRDSTLKIDQSGTIQDGACTGHSTTDLEQGLIAWWKFNGNADDSSTNARHATPTAMTLTTGQNGTANTAYSFNGSSSNAVVANSANTVSSATQLTMSAWFNSTGFGGERTFMTQRNVFSLTLFDSSVRYLIGTTGGTTGWTAANDKPCGCSANTWNLATMTWDGSTQRFYVNGALVGTATVTGTIIANSNNITFSPPGLLFSGSLDDMRIYNRVLSAGDVNALYTAGAQ